MSMEIFKFEGFHGTSAICGLQVYDRLSDNRVVVVVTELEENKGTSITNAAETLATQVCRARKISPHRLVWIEHYPQRGSALRPLEPTWDILTFEWDWKRMEFAEARWKPLLRIGFDAEMKDTVLRLNCCGECQ